MDSYCPLAWIGLSILPQLITPCGNWTGREADVESVRNDMLAGKEVPGCQQCHYLEKMGASSRRLEAIAVYGRPTTPVLKVLDISFDNVCNLKCRGCASVASHKWRNDEIAIYGRAFREEKFISSDIDLDLSSIERINISGGEALLSNRIDEFLERLIAGGNIANVELSLGTNCTVEPSETVIKALTMTKRTYISISIDGIGKLNDYFRSGSDFETCVHYMNLYNDLASKNPNIVIIINTTANIYNVNKIREIREFFKVNFPNFQPQHRLLQWPEQLAIQNMPADYKQLVRPYVEEFPDIIEALNIEGKDVYGHFLNFHNKLNELRNETLADINLMLEEYIASNPVETDSTAFFKLQIESI